MIRSTKLNVRIWNFWLILHRIYSSIEDLRASASLLVSGYVSVASTAGVSAHILLQVNKYDSVRFLLTTFQGFINHICHLFSHKSFEYVFLFSPTLTLPFSFFCSVDTVQTARKTIEATAVGSRGAKIPQVSSKGKIDSEIQRAQEKIWKNDLGLLDANKRGTVEQVMKTVTESGGTLSHNLRWGHL